MSQRQTSPPSVRECLEALRRHWKMIVCVYAVSIAAAVGGLMVWPETYASSAKLYVRMGRENIMLDPTVTASQMVMVQRSQENEINSLLDILESRWMAEQVVDAVGVEAILTGGPQQAEGTPAAAGYVQLAARQIRGWADQAVARVAYPLSDRERAIKRVRESVSVYAPKESTVITIAANAAAAEQAQRMAAAMTDAFLDAHLRLNRTRGTLKFFDEQANMLHGQLVQAREELRDRKNEFKTLSVEGTRSALEQQISASQLQARTTARELAEAQVKARVLQEQMDKVPPQVTGTTDGTANQGWDNMRQALYDLEIAEIEARAKYTAKHPLMESIAAQREQAAKILAGERPDRTETATSPSPTHQALELDLKRELANIAALESSRDLLSHQIEGLNKELTAVNSQEVQLNDLERRADLLEVNYRSHAEKLEEARIDDALETERISSLNVVQAATLESKPVSPKRALTLVSALVLATFGGFGLALIREYSNPHLRTPAQVEAAFDLPVLVTIPRAQLVRAALNGGSRTR